MFSIPHSTLGLREKKTKAATMRYGFTWHLLTIVETMHHEIQHDQRVHLKERSSPYGVSKERRWSYGDQSDIRNRLRHPYVSVIDYKVRQGDPYIKMFEE